MGLRCSVTVAGWDMDLQRIMRKGRLGLTYNTPRAIFAMLYDMEFIIYGLLGITERVAVIDTRSGEAGSTHVNHGPCL